MKASLYNILVPDDESGKLVLYNALSGALVVLGADEVTEAQQVLTYADTTSPAQETLVREFVKHRFLVPNETDELALVIARKRAGIKDKNRLDLILMPTLNCNFSCPYCYEDHIASAMSERTRDSIGRWLAQEIPRHKMLLLMWFGGEPLLAFRTVISLTQRAQQLALQSGVAFLGHITTNGYALDAGRIRQLLDAGIHEYQITLDGPPEQHNRTRVLRSGRETFHRIFENIIQLVRADEHVLVSLRINFNHQNLQSIPALLELFPTDVRSQIGVEMEPVFGNCQLSAVDNLPAGQISSAIASYCTFAQALGFRINHGLSNIRTGKLVYCHAERDSQMIVNYTGDVFKCGVCKFHTEERVGYIREDGTLVTTASEWEKFTGDPLFEEQCKVCSYLPLCMGGCRSTRLHNRNTGPYCTLVPTNTITMLKQIAFNKLHSALEVQP